MNGAIRSTSSPALSPMTHGLDFEETSRTRNDLHRVIGGLKCGAAESAGALFSTASKAHRRYYGCSMTNLYDWQDRWLPDHMNP